MGQKTEPRKRPTEYSQLSLTKKPSQFNGERIILSTNDVEQVTGHTLATKLI